MKEQKNSELVKEAPASVEQQAVVTKEIKEKKPRKKVKDPVMVAASKDADKKGPTEEKNEKSPMPEQEKREQEKNISKHIPTESSREPIKQGPHVPHGTKPPQPTTHYQKNDRQHGRYRNSGGQQHIPLDRRPIEELSLPELNLFARRYGIVWCRLDG